ncbi:MAG: aspartate--ammonia ligase [Mucinivorans sp.]
MRYRAKLTPETAESAIKEIKELFQRALSSRLGLRRVTAPLFVLEGSGINDDLGGGCPPVSFEVDDLGGQRAEVVQSLAKWKRLKLADYNIAPGYGLYTDMNAIRPHETLDALHSLYVDQWDWEKSILPEQRTVDYLKQTVNQIYEALLEVEAQLYAIHNHITPALPPQIYFIHAEHLLQRYPTMSPKEREAAIAKEYGAVFIIGIGAPLSNGEPHDRRAVDYDDYTSVGQDGLYGLNGDLILWNSVLESPFELSSMGVRVDAKALRLQLSAAGLEQKAQLPYHKALLGGTLPESIGGGIGQSRLCMFLLRTAHIGEVQASLWSEQMRSSLGAEGIFLK